jgi:Family of unknown function (DUF5677)
MTAKRYEPTLEEARRRYGEQHHIFRQILAAALSTDRAIAGTRAPSDLAYKGAVLFTKSLSHGMSLDRIVHRPGEANLYDVSSCAVLTRAIAETYLAFRYSAVEPTSDQDAAFRSALMEYHRWFKQEHVLRKFGVADDRLLEVAKHRLHQAASNLTSTDLFRQQGEDRRQRQLEGRVEMHRTARDIAEAAGIHPNMWVSTYAWLSQFTHSTPMAVLYLAKFRADQPIGVSSLSMMMQLSAAFIAKQLCDLERIFQGCCENHSEEQRKLIEVECKVLENMARPGEFEVE